MEANHRRGHYHIKRLEIENPQGKRYPLDSIFNIIKIDESVMDSNFLSGSIMFTDHNELVMTFPIIGEEVLYFEYQLTLDTPLIKHRFRIYAIEVSNGNGISKSRVCTASFVSDEVFHDQNTTISRSYKNKTIRTIVEDLHSEITVDSHAPLDISPTKGLHHFVIPRWTPMQTINYITTFAKHPSYESGLFFYFQNIDGFKYKCLEELFSQPPLGTFKQNLQIVDEGMLEKPGSILQMEVMSASIDQLKIMRSGAFNSRTIAYDPLVKTYKEIIYSYSKGDFSRVKTLNRYQLSTGQLKFDSPDQNVNYIVSDSIRRESTYFNDNWQNSHYSKNQEDTSFLKIALREHLLSKRLRIIIKGDDVPSLYESKPRHFASGEIISIEHKTRTVIEEKDGQNHGTLSGKYLVSRCTHMFEATKYVIEAEVISDSHAFLIENGKNI